MIIEELSYRLGFAAGVRSVTAPGGRAKSRAKSAAARANGKLGGRPKGAKDQHPRARGAARAVNTG